jgi:carboxylesterase type B
MQPEGHGIILKNPTPGIKHFELGMGEPTKDDPHVVSEDCLTLNVWTKPQVGEKKKAVFVWFYGGGS